jgi:hypothetical protein
MFEKRGAEKAVRLLGGGRKLTGMKGIKGDGGRLES